jgi:site-specific recombinase XerC
VKSGWTEPAQLDQLQRRDLVAYVQARQAAGLKPGSIRSELTVFRVFWRDLLAQEQVRAHPKAIICLAS